MSDGDVDKTKGRFKKAAGELTDDESLKNEGRVDKASGRIKEGIGDAADVVKDAVNPRERAER
ncbi:MAG: CsbD family protein [Solirubrobacterales bacterium]|nr:CsbD family protein [Solirubrobacterales bacterium]